MRTYETLEESMKTKKAIIISIEEYEHEGEKRQWIKARKSKGKNVYMVARYADGRYSSAV